MTATESWPIDLLSLADWERLPLDELHHVECVEGVLIVSPKPVSHHQRAMVNLVKVFDDHLPSTLVANADTEIVLSADPLTVRAPDVLVVDRSAAESGLPRFAPDQVHLVVEIISPGSRRQDRVMKYAEYAEAGIAEYWILDLDELAIAVHRLDETGSYHHVADLRGTAKDVACGAEITLDVDALASF